jgi:hypothetical protein
MTGMGLALVLALSVAGMTVPPERITTIARGTLSGISEAREVVVRDAAEWDTLWRQHAPEQQAPSVDFNRQTVIAVFMGTRPSAGFEVTIETVEAGRDGVVVRYRASRPAPDAMAAQILTSPFHIVSVSRFEGRARFVPVDADAGR